MEKQSKYVVEYILDSKAPLNIKSFMERLEFNF
jgi:hypothetical protein